MPGMGSLAMPGAGPFVARRPMGWDLTPADVLRLVRNDAHPVALCGAWAGGADVIAAGPVAVRAAPGPLDEVLGSDFGDLERGRPGRCLRRWLDRLPRLQRGRRGAAADGAARPARLVVRLLRPRAAPGPGDGGVALRGAVDRRARGRPGGAVRRADPPRGPRRRPRHAPGGRGPRLRVRHVPPHPRRRARTRRRSARRSSTSTRGTSSRPTSPCAPRRSSPATRSTRSARG